MSYECECGWKYVGGDTKEELLARIEHLREEHGMEPDTDEFSGKNEELISIIHTALHEIDTDELDGWYTSQIGRMRNDADEIIEWEMI